MNNKRSGTIARLPSESAGDVQLPPAEEVKEIDVARALSVINRGGRSAKPKKIGDRDMSNINFKIPTDILLRVDMALKNRQVPLTRLGWMLEAVVSQLEKEERK
jgi:hypothetical protein